MDQDRRVRAKRPRALGPQGQYTFSRAWSTVTSYELETPDFQARNWARQAGNRDHIMQMSFVYQLPWTTAGSGGWFRPIVNDWQLNSVFGAFTGVPFTVTADGTLLNTPGNTMTADLVRPLTKLRHVDLWPCGQWKNVFRACNKT